MKHLILAALVLVAGAGTGKINWREGRKYDAALAEAKATGLPLVLYFHTETCHYCVEMDKGAWADDEVAKASELLIPVNIMGEEKLMKQYKITGVPTVVFLDPEGNEVERLRGRDAGSVKSQFEDVAAKYTRGPKWLDTAAAALEAGKNDKKVVMLVFADDKKSAPFLKSFGDATYKDVFEKVAPAKIAFKKDCDECKTWKVTDASTVLLIDNSGDEPRVLKTVKGPKAPKELKKEIEEAIKKLEGGTK